MQNAATQPVADGVNGTIAVPVTTEQAVQSMLGTIGQVWAHFLTHLPLLVAGGLVLVATAGAAYLARRIVERFLRRSRLRRSLQELLQQVAFVAVWFIGLLLAAMVVFPGLTPTKALGGLGLLSVAVGFAFKDIFENFFAGVLLLWRFPFEADDYIECGDIIGQVERITVRMTVIRKPTDELIVVPNSFLFKNPVKVLTNRPQRRISIVTGVAYDVDVREAIEVIEKATQGCDSVSGNHPVQVFPRGFGSSSIDIEAAWWADPTPLGERRSRGEVVMGVKQALDEHGLEIPFPYRTLTFKEPLAIQQVGDSGSSQRDD